MKTVIIDTFAGPAEKGSFSPSVQNTLYLAEKGALAQVPQVILTVITQLCFQHHFEECFCMAFC